MLERPAAAPATVPATAPVPLYFLSFATNKYRSTLERIRKQAEDFGIFSEIFCLSESDIEPEFWNAHKNFIEQNPQGHGCWIWKPHIVHKIFQSLPENSILFYCDAGCTLFKEGIPRFMRYINHTLHSKYDNLSFQMNLPEKQFTRQSIMKHFNYSNGHTGQLLGGIFFLKKTNFTANLVQLWKNASQNYNLIGNVSSAELHYEDSEFIENRHDQSIFSVIRKIYGTSSIRDETFFGPPPAHENFKQYPIHATRLKY
jgi:hypothetical protein